MWPRVLIFTAVLSIADVLQLAERINLFLSNLVSEWFRRSYDTTKLYRDLKLRGAIIKDKELVRLPQEQIYENIDVYVWPFLSMPDSENLNRISSFPYLDS